MTERLLPYQEHLARVVTLLGAACALCVFAYGAFLLLAVAHTAARSSARAQITNLTARVGELQMRYLAATEELTPERAAALGFVPPREVVFVTPAHALSLGTPQ